MKRILSKENPFGFCDKGFLWEIAKEKGSKLHLDYGTHDGTVPAMLARQGMISSCIGVDIDAEAVSKSASSMPKNVRLSVIKKNQDLPFESGCFDSASILQVIEHVYEQEQLLTRINRVLKPGGWIIVSAPGKHIFSFLDIGNWKFMFPRIHKYYYSKKYSSEAYHERYVECRNGIFGDIETEKMWHQHFKPKELKQLLEKCGFEIVEDDGAGYFMRILTLLDYLVPMPKFARACVRKLSQLDDSTWSSADIFVCARKSIVADKADTLQ